MNKFPILKILILMSIIFILVDIIVLSILSEQWNNVIKKIQNKPLKVNYKYAFLTYVFLVFGLYYFVYKNINIKSWKYDAIVKGFIFGAVVYGVFDLTNLSIFTNYDVSIAIIDTLWGGTLSAIVCGTTYYLLNINDINKIK